MKNLYLKNRFFKLIGIIVVIFLISFSIPFLFEVAKVLFILFIALLLIDIILLFFPKNKLRAKRFTSLKLSNGDQNKIKIFLENKYPFQVHVKIIDELPEQLQNRDMEISISCNPGEKKSLNYFIRPVKRGEYHFGNINLYAVSKVGLISRRFKIKKPEMIPVYPSYIQMRKYELLAISNKLTEFGIKKIRRIGHQLEFEQIKEYVTGDDYRTINWKATARKNQLMVNSYQDERSQQVYSVIDKGRVMQMPFNQLSLLDYAINTSLAISNIALKKDDKPGLITFQHKIGTMVPASRRNNQMFFIQEALYNQKTAYKESDYSILFANIRRKITTRSLLLLFTNFESHLSLERQLPFLARLNKDHILIVIFFENTQLDSLLNESVTSVKDIYHKTIAKKIQFEKRLIVKELKKHGIHAILTPPEKLTIHTVNKYLELKAIGLI